MRGLGVAVSGGAAMYVRGCRALPLGTSCRTRCASSRSGPLPWDHPGSQEGFPEELFEHPRPQTASGSAARPSRARSDHPVDFLVGLAIRRHAAGYAIFRFKDMEPVQFGLIDVIKADDNQQKGLEIAAALRQLRKKTTRRSAHDLVKPAEGWRWSVSFDNSLVDRAFPKGPTAVNTLRDVSMLQGLVVSDAKRIFKAAGYLVHPRKSRLMLGIRGSGFESRKQVHDMAKERMPDFPAMTVRSGALDERSLLISDAWAVAQFARRATVVAEQQKKAHVMDRLRQEVLESKQLRRLAEAVEQLYPRRVGKDLEEVLESRVERLVKQRLYRDYDRKHQLGWRDS